MLGTVVVFGGLIAYTVISKLAEGGLDDNETLISIALLAVVAIACVGAAIVQFRRAKSGLDEDDL